MKQGGNILFLWLPCLLGICSTHEIKVNSSCFDAALDLPNHSCRMLTEELSSVESSTTLLLEPGLHIIDSYLWVLNKTDLNITGSPADPSSVVIECDDSYGLIFIDIERLTLRGLTVRDCGFKGTENVSSTFSYVRNFIDLFYEQKSDFSTGIFMAHVSDLVMEDVVIDQNEGFGMVGINIIGDSKFVNANFTQNNPRECELNLTNLAQFGDTGGGMFLLYQDYTQITKNITSSLLIKNAVVDGNSNCRSDLLTVQHGLLSRSLEPRLLNNNLFVGAGGITISLAQSHYIVNANVTDSTFRNNSGIYHGSGLEVTYFEFTSDCHVFVTNTEFEDNGRILETKSGPVTANPNGALVAVFYLPIPASHFDAEVLSDIVMQLKSSVRVINCTFRRNVATSGSGITVFSFGPTVSDFQEEQMIIRDCLFDGNVGEYGSAIYITEISYSAFEAGLIVTVESIDVIYNRKLTSSPATSFESDATGVVDINFVNVSLSGTNHFDSNEDTAVSVYSGILTLTGSTFFTNNTGAYGGGLSLDAESYLVLVGESANLSFENNRALVNGGGIYVDLGTMRTAHYDCFLFFDRIDILCDVSDECSQPRDRFHMSFINNAAQFGEAIFGSSFSTCPWTNGSIRFNDNNMTMFTVDNFTLPISFSPRNSSSRIINTDARMIRVGNRTAHFPDTPHLNENNSIRVFPGQQFLVPLGTLDQLDQTVPLTIFSQLKTEPGDKAYSQIGGSNRFLISGGDDDFTDIPLFVYGEQNTSYDMTITSNEALVFFEIRVSLDPCPVGFSFNESSHTCMCDISLEQVSCNNNGTITHRAGYWVGVDVNFNYIQRRCILNYCKDEITILNLEEPDSQCRDNRSGVLCGGCREGFSRMIGTNACGVCDSYWNLLYILLFAVLGILLFAYLAVFNVTITDGYLNGFIFYSNIIEIYLIYFVPRLISFNIAEKLPGIVISFLSLNFGIPICFHPGMTELELGFLRFVFPIYLMLIVLIVTVCGKYISNQLVAKFFQKINVTRVFATLILISYTSFLQTCFAILVFITIDNAANPVRWAIDSNVLYDNPLHISLVVLSTIFLSLLIPFPLFLLFPRVIFRTPVLKKLKPLVDAFIAPLAPKMEFWVGLRMIFRLVFLVISILLSEDEIAIVVYAVLIAVLTVVEVRVQPFNSFMRNFVNNVLMTNMTVFSITAIFGNEERLKNFNIFNLYVFLAMFLLLNAYYLLIRFKRTRNACKRFIYSFKGLKQNMKSEKKKSERKEDLATGDSTCGLVPQTSVEFQIPKDNFKETNYIPFREALVLLEAEDSDIFPALKPAENT